MATRFRYLRSVIKTYDEQGEIYFLCRRYAHQPAYIQQRIDRLCKQAGGEYAVALFAFLCTGTTWQSVCDSYHVSQDTLRRARDRFYDMW